jgi:hypothetical protein
MAEKIANVKTEKVWSANAKQKDFMEVLGTYENGATLTDIAIDTGKQFATGTINTLVSKGLVVAEDFVRVSEVVYRGVVIAEKKDKVKRYRLA